MPKDEFDFADPLELNGMAFSTDEDTTDAMCECFIEEFMRMGYTADQVMTLFRNPHYLGMNLVLENRGEQFVRDRIGEIFALWGRGLGKGGLPAARTEVPVPTQVGDPVSEPNL